MKNDLNGEVQIAPGFFIELSRKKTLKLSEVVWSQEIASKLCTIPPCLCQKEIVLLWEMIFRNTSLESIENSKQRSSKIISLTAVHGEVTVKGAEPKHNCYKYLWSFSSKVVFSSSSLQTC